MAFSGLIPANEVNARTRLNTRDIIIIFKLFMVLQITSRIHDNGYILFQIPKIPLSLIPENFVVSHLFCML